MRKVLLFLIIHAKFASDVCFVVDLAVRKRKIYISETISLEYNTAYIHIIFIIIYMDKYYAAMA